MTDGMPRNWDDDTRAEIAARLDAVFDVVARVRARASGGHRRCSARSSVMRRREPRASIPEPGDERPIRVWPKPRFQGALETDEAAMTSRGRNVPDEESPTKTIWKDSIRARG